MKSERFKIFLNKNEKNIEPSCPLSLKITSNSWGGIPNLPRSVNSNAIRLLRFKRIAYGVNDDRGYLLTFYIHNVRDRQKVTVMCHLS